MDKSHLKVPSQIKGSLATLNTDDTDVYQTQSAVDHVVRNLMSNENEESKRLQILNWCKGNPLTETGKRKQMAKLLIMAMIPIITLTVLTIVGLERVQSSNKWRSTIRDIIVFSTQTGTVIHYLQRERDMTALHLTSGGTETRLFLRERYPATDSAIRSLSMWPLYAMKGTMLAQHATAIDFLIYLRKHRNELNQQTSDPYAEIRFYTEMIRSFIDVVYTSIQESRDGDQWRSMVAYQLLIVSKEDMGVERSLGGVFYSLGRFNQQQHFLWFQEKRAVGSANLITSKRFSPIVQENYDRLEETKNFTENINRMREVISLNDASKFQASIIASTYWFDNMTLLVDIMFDTQNRLAASIINQLESSLFRDRGLIVTSICLFLLAVIIAPVCVFSIRAIIHDVQSYAFTLATQTKKLSMERHRTEAILYQLLPQPVADELRKGNTVEAEAYEESTIFFSDIVGFTTISSACTPLQVVNMLNKLYLCFDTRIDKYQVYKIETIGDAYMVASGVPKRIGQRHAHELALMALDLLHHVTHLEIPHMPTQRMTLRAGMHSGPCVAGVVGSKMPRYCLFGATVNLASKMESSGAPGKVQISEHTRNFLINDTSYTIEPRIKEHHGTGNVSIEDQGVGRSIRGAVDHSELYGQATFWLLDRKGFLDSLPCYPKCKETTEHLMDFRSMQSRTETPLAAES